MTLVETLNKAFEELRKSPPCVDNNCRACHLRNAVLDSNVGVIPLRIYNDLTIDHAIGIKEALLQAFALGLEIGEAHKVIITVEEMK